MAKLVKQEKHESLVVLYNIRAPSVEGHSITCPRCSRVHGNLKLKIGQMVACECGKKFDCVWYRPVNDPKELQDYVNKALAEAPGTSFDFETDGGEDTGNDPFTRNLVGVSFCRWDQPRVAIYVPLRHVVGFNMDEAVCKEICAPFVEQHPMAAHNFYGMEWPWTYVKWGVEPKVGYDTMIISWMDDTNRTHRFDPRGIGLKDMAREWWDIDVTALKQLVDLKTQNFSVVPIKLAYPYGCQDSDLSTRIVTEKVEKVKKEQGSVFELETSLISVVAKMHLRGIVLDANLLAEGATKLDQEIKELELEVFQEMGFEVQPDPMSGHWLRPFDLGSPKKVSEHLFFKMGLPYDQRDVGKSGVPSSGKDELEQYRSAYPVVDKMLKHREAVHMRDNFLAALPGYTNAITGAIHGFFNQCGAPTGRFSHSKPNLAQIPKLRD